MEPPLPPTHYRMPAEWEPHAATWIAWPHRRSDWPGKFTPIAWVYCEIVKHLHQREPVHILVNDENARARVEKALLRSDVDLGRVRFHVWPTDRSWARDFGPAFLLGPAGEKALLDWRFSAWAKYPDWHNDDKIPQRVAETLRLPVRQPAYKGERVVLEGGAIDVNGAGLMLTTEECLLGDVQVRNPDFGRDDYEKVFAEYLGIKKTLWLNRGIAGDDTHGHVDDLARFVGPRTVVLVVEDDPADVNYAPLQENLDRLRGMTDLDGKKLEVVPLPMPRPLVFDGQRLPASYANFYIADGAVLVPTFNDPADRVALGTLAELLPGREVIGIHAVDLVWGLGTLHCLTQQEPGGGTATPAARKRGKGRPQAGRD